MRNLARGIGPLSILVAAGLGSACSGDTLDPDDREPVYDVVVTLSAAEANKGSDAVTGLAIADPADMRVPYSISNRGRLPSPAHKVVVWVGEGPDQLGGGILFGGSSYRVYSPGDTIAVPVLAPGDSITGVARVSTTQKFLISNSASSDSVVAHASLLLPDTLDGDHETNTAVSPPFYIALGVVWAEMAQVVSKVRTNEALPVTLTLTNYSRHASASGVSARLCFFDFMDGCTTYQWTSFGARDFPTVAPGATTVLQYSPIVLPSATFQRYAARVAVAVCLVHSSWNDPYMGSVRVETNLQLQDCTDGGGSVVVSPDYMTACNPPFLTDGLTVSLPAPNCGLLPDTQQPLSAQDRQGFESRRKGSAFYTFAFHGTAGETYRHSPGVVGRYNTHGYGFGIENAGNNEFRVLHTGTYLLQSYTQSSMTLVRVEE